MEVPVLRDCSDGRSFFQFIDDYWSDVPVGVQPRYTLHRICTLMRRMRAQTALIEELDDEATEWRSISCEIAAIQKRLGKRLPPPMIRKFTFVRRPVPTTEDIAGIPNGDFLGYAILVTVEVHPGQFHSYIFESVIRELGLPFPGSGPDGEDWLPLLNNYLHVKKPFSCAVGPAHERIKDYAITGSFFCQQNQITGVCAHACVAMVLNNCREIREKIRCEDINELLGIDHDRNMLRTDWAVNDRARWDGLEVGQLVQVLQHYGFDVQHLSSDEDIDYYRDFLYGFVESGYPALLAFSTSVNPDRIEHHVVPVLGHTLNSDSWAPQAFAGYVAGSLPDRRYLSSLDWVTNFVIHDDNFGMYFCLPAHSFRPEGHPNPAHRFAPQDAIGVFPKGMGAGLLSYQAADLAFLRLCEYLESCLKAAELPLVTYYTKHLLPHLLGRNTAVFRPILLTPDQYLAHLARTDNQQVTLTETEKQRIEDIITGMRSFWLVEVTEPDLYVGNKSKVVDVLIDPSVSYEKAKTSSDTTTGVLLMRFPGFVVVPDGSEYAVATLLGSEGHWPLFRFEDSRPASTDW